MNARFKLLALSAAIAAGAVASPAQAYVYSESRLLINNLTIAVTPNSGSTVTNFTFNAQTNAALNGVSAPPGNVSCFGSPGAPGVANTCSPSTPRLIAPAANANGVNVRANNSFAITTPIINQQFSNSAAMINTATVTGDPSTSTSQVAESELTSALSANASALIQSTTGFTFTFTLAAPGTFALNFDANPDQFAQVAESQTGLFSAQSNMSASFTLQQVQTGGIPALQRAVFSPDGSGNGTTCDNAVTNGLSCTTVDTQGLNQTIGVTGVGTAALSNDGVAPFTHFMLNVTGLLAGTYTLTLAANTSTDVTRLVVPEPDSLLLLGVGLAALALRARRSQKKQAA